jgi:flagellin
MSISLNTNVSATRAAAELSQHYTAQQKTINQLTSGERMTSAADDTGAFSNAIDLRSALSRSSATTAILSNALSFLQAQGSTLQHLAKIVSRMSDISALMRDPTKLSEDLDSYASEFKALQSEIITLSQAKFNETSLFATTGSGDSTLTIFTDDTGGQTIDLNQADLLQLQVVSLTDSNAGFGFDESSYSISGSTNGLPWGPGAISDPQDGVFGSIGSTDIETLAQLLSVNSTQQAQVRFSMDRVQGTALSIERSRGLLVDTNVAESTQDLSRSNILIQTSAAALTTANKVQESMLSLLKPS